MKLTEAQESFLREVAKAPRSTSPATGGVARALEARKLVTVRYRIGTEVTITDLGREVLAALDGAGRQTSLPKPRRARAQPTTCPLCHRGTRLRAPPAAPTLFSHRNGDGKLCDAAGSTVEQAREIALERRIAVRLREGATPDEIAGAMNITIGRVAVVQTKIDDGRI